MKIESHLEKLKESDDVIRQCIEEGLIAKRQRTIGFHASAAAIDLLEIFLHKKHLIDPGKQIKHDWFTSKNKIQEKLDFEFENKKQILEAIFLIESRRNVLCYGSPQSEEFIEEIVRAFLKLKELFKGLGVEYD